MVETDQDTLELVVVALTEVAIHSEQADYRCFLVVVSSWLIAVSMKAQHLNMNDEIGLNDVDNS